MQIVTEEQLTTIALVRLTEDISKIEFVRKLLAESKKIESKKKIIILVDCEFSRMKVIRFLDGHAVDGIVPPI